MAQSRTESRRLRGGDLTRQAMAVVAEVGDLAPPAAEQAVRDRCGGSAGLLAECLSLLRHDRTPGALPLLPPPRGEGPPDAVARLVRSPPQRIGRYVLGELIGCGATGAVFCARSEEVPRDVALKLIPAPRAHCGPPVLRIESAALARLSHPAIANVLDAGVEQVESGEIFYLAIELVAGEPITSYARRRAMQPRQLALLMAEVCDAISHAHQRGVVHRDIKPQHILVSEPGESVEPALKLLDFGLAHLVTAESAPGHELAGTMPYAAPEQMTPGAVVDVRADIYAAGAVVYELLAGRQALAMQRPLLPGVAPVSEPARIRARGVARAVGAVARCAMAPDPEDRYPSAAAMADDLRRAAAGLPTQAAPAGPLAHLRGLWRQRPGLCAAGAAAIICLGAGAAVASAAYVRASRAEQALRESNESLRSVVAALAGGAVARLADTPGSMAQRRAILLELEAQLRPLLPADDAAGADRAPGDAALRAYSDVLDGLGDMALAEDRLRDCLDIRRHTAGILTDLASRAPHDLELHANLSIAIVKLGDVIGGLGDRDEQDRLYLEALDIDERLRAAAPRDRRLTDNLVRSYTRLASAASRRDDLSEELRRGRQALDLAQRLAGFTPDHPTTLHACFEANLIYSIAAQRSGLVAESRAAAAESRTAARRLAEVAPLNYSTFDALVRSTIHAAELLGDEVDEALVADLAAMIRRMRDLCAADPSDGMRRALLGDYERGLVTRLQRIGRHREATDLLAESARGAADALTTASVARSLAASVTQLLVAPQPTATSAAAAAEGLGALRRLQGDPRLGAEAHSLLAMIGIREGASDAERQEAVRLARRGVALEPHEPLRRLALAAALTAAGKLELARGAVPEGPLPEAAGYPAIERVKQAVEASGH